MRWREARTAEERHAAIEEALARAEGNITHAAEDLGLSRKHLSRIVNGPLPENEDLVGLSVMLPRELVEWTDLEAVRWKHRTGARHPSKSAVVADLIRRAMADARG